MTSTERKKRGTRKNNKGMSGLKKAKKESNEKSDCIYVCPKEDFVQC
jgi:hypothetical protein